MRIWFSGIYDADVHDEARILNERFARRLARHLIARAYETTLEFFLFFPSIIDHRQHGTFGSNRRTHRRKLNELHVVQSMDYDLWRQADYPTRMDMVAHCLTIAVTETPDRLIPQTDKSQILAAIENTRLEMRCNPPLH